MQRCVLAALLLLRLAAGTQDENTVSQESSSSLPADVTTPFQEKNDSLNEDEQKKIDIPFKEFMVELDRKVGPDEKESAGAKRLNAGVKLLEAIVEHDISVTEGLGEHIRLYLLGEADGAISYIHKHHAALGRTAETHFSKIKKDLEALTETGKTKSSMTDIRNHVRSLNKLLQFQARFILHKT
ncbi:uncharacterized protein LOC128996426 [Macrosteles quadrilineatus]|uniref:uncharacterized protein LOC128996426 n=1 Tax=Macrosteles quadrilineatus TaxID=74068 RepID=UPI0023E23ABB|nr:uncharacterized protein LOC128996426 [Macrosteles quadrilineatus]